MWATLQERLMEADEQVERRGVVWQTLRRVAGALDALGVRYAVVGGVAMQHHGVLRSTQEVDLLIESTEQLDAVHQRLVGHGYVAKAPGSRLLRDEVTRVRIEFLVCGEYPGDGRPKPVSFPHPADVAECSNDGLSFVKLETLIELKLASAKSAPHRMRDRSDVLELIHHLRLSPDFGCRLNPYVQDEFVALATLPAPGESD